MDSLEDAPEELGLREPDLPLSEPDLALSGPDFVASVFDLILDGGFCRGVGDLEECVSNCGKKLRV